MNRVNDILKFWFGEMPSKDHFPKDKSPLWFKKDPEVDKTIKSNFETDLLAAAEGKHKDWLSDGNGCMAQIVLFDQFSRNIYRNTAKAFSFDHLSLDITMNAIRSGLDKSLPYVFRTFFYLPLEHSEDPEVQSLSIEMFESLVQDVPSNQKSTYKGFLDYAYKHKEIIDRFGRYPHRNELLGRKSTQEEIDFLKQPGSRF